MAKVEKNGHVPIHSSSGNSCARTVIGVPRMQARPVAQFRAYRLPIPSVLERIPVEGGGAQPQERGERQS